MDEIRFENLLKSMEGDLPEPPQELVERVIEETMELERQLELQRQEFAGVTFENIDIGPSKQDEAERDPSKQDGFENEPSKTDELEIQPEADQMEASAPLPDKIPRKQPPPPRGVRPDRASRRARERQERELARSRELSAERGAMEQEELQDSMAEAGDEALSDSGLSATARERAAKASVSGQRTKIGLAELIRQEEEAKLSPQSKDASERTKSRAAEVEEYKKRRAAKAKAQQPSMQMNPFEQDEPMVMKNRNQPPFPQV